VRSASSNLAELTLRCLTFGAKKDRCRHHQRCRYTEVIEFSKEVSNKDPGLFGQAHLRRINAEVLLAQALDIYSSTSGMPSWLKIQLLIHPIP
jgi:hypothetical protein